MPHSVDGFLIGNAVSRPCKPLGQDGYRRSAREHGLVLHRIRRGSSLDVLQCHRTALLLKLTPANDLGMARPIAPLAVWGEGRHRE